DRADLIAVHTADECDALARSHSLRDHCGHVPALTGGRLYALKKEQVLLARLQIIDVKRADDLLSVDHVARIDRSARCSSCLGVRRMSVGRERSRRSDCSGDEITPIEAVEPWIVGHGVDPFICGA